MEWEICLTKLLPAIPAKTGVLHIKRAKEGRAKVYFCALIACQLFKFPDWMQQAKLECVENFKLVALLLHILIINSVKPLEL